MNRTQNTSANWVIWLLLWFLCRPKVILLSGGHCNLIEVQITGNICSPRNYNDHRSWYVGNLLSSHQRQRLMSPLLSYLVLVRVYVPHCVKVSNTQSLTCSGTYLQWPMVVLNLGESASLGTWITISTLLAVDRRLNWDFAFTMISTREWAWRSMTDSIQIKGLIYRFDNIERTIIHQSLQNHLNIFADHFSRVGPVPLFQMLLTCVFRRYDISSNSPSGGMKEMVRSLSNLEVTKKQRSLTTRQN